MAKIGLRLDTRRPLADGTYPIYLRVQNKRDFLISTGQSCRQDEWKDNKIMTGNKKMDMARNALLQQKVNNANLVCIELELRDDHNVSDSTLRMMIRNKLEGRQDKGYTLVSALEEQSRNKRLNTQLSYRQTIKKVEEFRDVQLSELNVRWLSDFTEHLKGTGLKTNSIAIYLRNIRAAVNYANDMAYTDNYPFRKFKIKTEMTRKRSLSIEELKQFRDYDCEPYLDQYRDMFMLSFYLIGINSIDLFNLQGIINGRIEYHRSKTNKFYSIKVEPEAMRIIEKHRGKNYLLDVLDRYSDYRSYNSKLNKMLKRVGEVHVGRNGKKSFAPLHPDISVYWARHTWATIAAEVDVPDAIISQSLGHEPENRTSEIYIKRRLEKVDEANRRVLDAIL